MSVDYSPTPNAPQYTVPSVHVLELPVWYPGVPSGHGQRNFKDTNSLMSSLLLIFVWGAEAIS